MNNLPTPTNSQSKELPGTMPDDIRRLEPSAITLHTSYTGKLVLSLDGQTHEGIRPARAFPLSNANQFIFLIDSDDKTLGFIEVIDSLDDESRAALQKELHYQYYSSTIKSIVSAESRYGITTWNLITEQGPRTIHVKDRNDIRHLHSGTVIFTDAHGMKFTIPDRHKLDSTSMMHLESES
jgi:hypothetical protein